MPGEEIYDLLILNFIYCRLDFFGKSSSSKKMNANKGLMLECTADMRFSVKSLSCLSTFNNVNQVDFVVKGLNNRYDV